MKVAIIRLSALGDVVVSAVFLPFLKQRYKGVKIHWFVDENFAPILKDAPHIDVVVVLEYPHFGQRADRPAHAKNTAGFKVGGDFSQEKA